MRTLSALLLGFLMLTGCANGQQPTGLTSDMEATARAPWKVGEVLLTYTTGFTYDPSLRRHDYQIARQFLGITREGYVLVQDFYAGAGEAVKYSDPVAFMDKEAVKYIGLMPYAIDANFFIHGPYTLWSPEGKLIVQGQYDHGKLQGQWTWWWPGSGEMQQQGEYQNGLRQGLWREYAPNGQLGKEGRYLNGKRQGVWSSYNESGRKIGETTYEDDAIIDDNRY